MRIERFLLLLGLLNLVVLIANLGYLIVAGWLPGS